MTVTIYHNPRCSKSRKTLQLLEESGVAHDVVHYLENPPTAARIRELASKIGVSAEQLLRRGEDVYKNAENPPDIRDDAAVAAWIAEHPKALQRPIVVDDERGVAVIGRPPENVHSLLQE